MLEKKNVCFTLCSVDYVILCKIPVISPGSIQLRKGLGQDMSGRAYIQVEGAGGIGF